MFNPFLTFSDSAKYAEAAKNLLTNQSLGIHHSFFDPNVLAAFHPGQTFPVYFLPLVPQVLSLFFKVLPATDTTLALLGSIGLVIIWLLTFLISRSLHSIKAAIISLVFITSSLFFWEYARNATTEIFFTIEILALIYLFIRPSTRLLAILPLGLMFLTRQQAVLILGAGLITLIWLFLRGKSQLHTKLIAFFALAVLTFFLVSLSLANQNSIFSPLKVIGAINISTSVAQGNYLRGGTYNSEGFKALISKVIYNTYNYFKNPERLASPIIFGFFILGLFLRYPKPAVKWFYIFASLTVLFFILGASATLPNARYVHPVIPLVFIGASMSLAEISNLFNKQKIALAILLFFVALPALGFFTLDTRFRQNQYNTDKPPVYKIISEIMAENIPKNHLIITNLDAWAAWYQGLTTMWFPLSPDLLQPATNQTNKIDYIVITNYLENDSDFALGPWKEVVYTPDKITNHFLVNNYKVLKIFTITPDQDYEKQEYKGTILIKK